MQVKVISEKLPQAGLWNVKTEMSNQKYVEIPIPEKEYDELAKLAKELGFASVDEFAEKAAREYVKHLKQEAEAK